MEKKDFNKITNDLQKGFFGFWVKKYRVSFLLIFLLIFTGIFSLYKIPKESSPDIELGIIAVTTIYTGVNPTDIDSLITDKIENEIKDITGINKITSTSSVGMSSIIVELKNGVLSRDVMTDIKDKVDKLDLPDDALDTSVAEISTSNTLMFEVLLYGDSNKFSQFDLIQASQIIKSNLEGTNQIESIDLSGANLKLGVSTKTSDYEIKVLLDKDKIEQLGLNLSLISSIIKSYNKNTPIGNFTLGKLSYDYRFDGELNSIEGLKNIIIKSTNGSNILLGDISTIVKEYPSEAIKNLGFYNESGYNFTSLTFNKSKGSNIFSVSKNAKSALENFINTNPNFKNLKIKYKNDMSETIIKDYKNLSGTAVQTLLLVFFTILLFVGFRESLIASMLLPLSFLITFIVLDIMGFSLNFLTNFSLVLTLGIAIDTMIVIIEGSSEKMHLGYNKLQAVLLAIKDYKGPLISGTMTTLVAFLPLIFLPGLMGKFLAYIPITVFSTLVAALFLSLTVSSALFITFVKESKYFNVDKKFEETFTKKQKEYLDYQRQNKEIKKEEKTSIRFKILKKLGEKYYNLLFKLISKRSYRLQLIFYPLIGLILTFVFLAPKIGFTLFPKTDESIITGTIEAREGTSSESLEDYLGKINDVIKKYKELKVYYLSISGNVIDVYIELKDDLVRKKENLRNIFEVEETLSKDLKFLESDGLLLSIGTISNGPPTGKSVGIKLISNNAKNIEQLKTTANDFKNYFKTISGVKNISTTSKDTPGQFIFTFKKDKLSQVGLNPNDILSELYLYTNGLKSGSIKSQYEDNDIVLKIKEFDEELSPENINNLIINTKIGKIRLGDFADYKFTKAVSSINRENTKISITVEADLEFGVLSSEIQPLLNEFANNYSYKEGIYFEKGGENSENADLIISVI